MRSLVTGAGPMLAHGNNGANRRAVPYQSLLKIFLAERLAQQRLTRPK